MYKIPAANYYGLKHQIQNNSTLEWPKIFLTSASASVDKIRWPKSLTRFAFYSHLDPTEPVNCSRYTDMIIPTDSSSTWVFYRIFKFLSLICLCLFHDFTTSICWALVIRLMKNEVAFLPRSSCHIDGKQKSRNDWWVNFKTIFLLLQFNGLSGRSLHHADKRQVDECAALNPTPEECSTYWGGEKPPLLVVSLDGFRFDYLQRTVNISGVEEPASPLINRLSRCGVFSPSGMIPVFPSLTFPNHYSIVTGLYPESHGIVANSFYDPDLNASFSLSSSQQTNPVWWIGDPLWYDVKRQVRHTFFYYFVSHCQF